MNVKISKGNSKLGAIPSVSLPAGKTCRNDCECSNKCYAKKLERLRKTVREAYQHNYDLLNNKTPNCNHKNNQMEKRINHFITPDPYSASVHPVIES